MQRHAPVVVELRHYGPAIRKRRAQMATSHNRSSYRVCCIPHCKGLLGVCLAKQDVDNLAHFFHFSHDVQRAAAVDLVPQPLHDHTAALCME